MNQKTIEKLQLIVRDNYESIASDFNETRKKPLWPALADILRDVQDRQSVLDVGCGNGRLLEAMSVKSIEYFGIDQSRELIALAQKNYPTYSFGVGDILSLGDITQKKYDWVTSIAVLHHIPGDELRQKALRELQVRMKDDGRIILTVWNLWQHKKYKHLIWQFAWQKIIGRHKMDFGDLLFSWKNQNDITEKQRYYHAFTVSGLRKLAKKSGLSIEKMIIDDYNYYLVLKK